MAFRTVVIDSHSKLDYSLSYLVFRTPEVTKKILLDEVHTLIVTSTAVSLTTCLINELIKHKIKVIFCDEKHNPCCELIPSAGNSNSPKRINEQINWSPEVCDLLWKFIIRRKIQNQSSFLKERNMPNWASFLDDFANNVEFGDVTNREEHAAKVYFNHAFYEGFTRDKDCFLNACLNYGYSILLSEFNRAVIAAGYLTQLGIHHKNEFNEFNLSCDLMEPFRFIVDRKAASLTEKEDFKKEMVNLLNEEYLQVGKKQSLVNAISIYCNSIFSVLNKGDISKIAFIEYELGG